MNRRHLSRYATLGGLLLVASGLVGYPATNTSVAALQLPPLVLWAWERPEDLRFLDPGRSAVAVLVGSLTLAGDRTRVRPRRQPLRVPAGTPLVAVLRIDRAPADPPTLGAAQRETALAAIVSLSELDGVTAVQLDFDAVRSERRFYRDLLRDVRRRLPAALPLTITALASWCMGDPWLRGLPIADAVPMLFRMGADGPAIRRYLAGGGDFSSAVCRQSVGVSTDEPWPRFPAGRRVFVFHPEPWTRNARSRLDDLRGLPR